MARNSDALALDPDAPVRLLRRPGFQRAAAIALNGAGLAGGVIAAAVLLAHGAETRGTRLSPLSLQFHAVEAVAMLAMIIAAGCMGIFLALRGHRSALARLLALSCGFVSSLFGIGIGVQQWWRTIDLVAHWDFVMWSSGVTAVVLGVAFFLGIYGVVQFLAAYPKPVRLLGTALTADGAAKKSPGVLRDLPWIRSPQCAALLAGGAVIALLGTALDLTQSRINTFLAYYVACWLPLAVISAKQAKLPEEDRRNVRWVFLGQAIWLCLFLLALITVYALVWSGAVRFANWNDGLVFATGFFTVSFASAVIVLLATLAISIFYDGTFDPDLMIRRTWVAAVVGLLFGALFVLLERLLAQAVADWLGISTANALTIVAAITAGVIYPIRSWVEQRVRGFIERWHAAQSIANGVRQDAAIVFADLSGYTALTERNEREALIMAAVFHRDGQTIAASNGGRLIKTIGDAVLLRFADAASAFRATREIKQRFAEHILAMHMTPLPVHAGIHFGEVVEGPTGDVFGSTVNIAARLLGTAGADEVVASRIAVEASRHQEDARFLGQKKLKNVEVPVDCFLLAAHA